MEVDLRRDTILVVIQYDPIPSWHQTYVYQTYIDLLIKVYWDNKLITLSIFQIIWNYWGLHEKQSILYFEFLLICLYIIYKYDVYVNFMFSYFGFVLEWMNVDHR